MIIKNSKEIRMDEYVISLRFFSDILLHKTIQTFTQGHSPIKMPLIIFSIFINVDFAIRKLL